MVRVVGDAVYARIRERANEYGLTKSEAHAIDTARSQLQTYSQIGGLTAASFGIFMGCRRLVTPFQVAALGSMSLFLGAQVGLMLGTVVAARTIQAVPEHQRLIRLFDDVQNELLAARWFRRTVPKPGAMEPASFGNWVDHNSSPATLSSLEPETSASFESSFIETSTWEKIRHHHIQNHPWTKPHSKDTFMPC